MCLRQEHGLKVIVRAVVLVLVVRGVAVVVRIRKWLNSQSGASEVLLCSGTVKTGIPGF